MKIEWCLKLFWKLSSHGFIVLKVFDVWSFSKLAESFESLNWPSGKDFNLKLSLLVEQRPDEDPALLGLFVEFFVQGFHSWCSWWCYIGDFFHHFHYMNFWSWCRSTQGFASVWHVLLLWWVVHRCTVLSGAWLASLDTLSAPTSPQNGFQTRLKKRWTSQRSRETGCFLFCMQSRRICRPRLDLLGFLAYKTWGPPVPGVSVGAPLMRCEFVFP